MRPKRAAFTLFPRDYLGWPEREFLSPAQKGDLFELIAYAAETGTGTLPLGHPLLDRLDPTVLRLVLVPEGDVLALRQPFDLPTLLAGREHWIEGKRKAGEASAAKRRAVHGSAQPRASGPNTTSALPEHTLPNRRTSGTERNGTDLHGREEGNGAERRGEERESPARKCAVAGCARDALDGAPARCPVHAPNGTVLTPRALVWRDPDSDRREG